MRATFAKLKNGTWGVQAEGRIVPGQYVEITTRTGEIKIGYVNRVLAFNGAKSLCSLIKGAMVLPPQDLVDEY